VYFGLCLIPDIGKKLLICILPVNGHIVKSSSRQKRRTIKQQMMTTSRLSMSITTHIELLVPVDNSFFLRLSVVWCLQLWFRRWPTVGHLMVTRRILQQYFDKASFCKKKSNTIMKIKRMWMTHHNVSVYEVFVYFNNLGMVTFQ